MECFPVKARVKCFEHQVEYVGQGRYVYYTAEEQFNSWATENEGDIKIYQITPYPSFKRKVDEEVALACNAILVVYVET